MDRHIFQEPEYLGKQTLHVTPTFGAILLEIRDRGDGSVLSSFRLRLEDTGEFAAAVWECSPGARGTQGIQGIQGIQNTVPVVGPLIKPSVDPSVDPSVEPTEKVD